MNPTTPPIHRAGLQAARALACLALAAGMASCSSEPCGGAPPADVPAGHVLLDPDSPELKQVPPDSFDVRFETTKGDVVVRIHREWAPMGVFRFYNLARNGFYDGARFYRVLPGFVAQFGASGRPQIDQVWHGQPMPDDPRRVSNRAGTLSYAMAGPDSRTTQLFFNYGENVVLDEQNFAPIGRVIEGMGALYLLHSDYGETQPQGSGPYFGCILSHGNAYLSARYRRLDYIERAIVVEH
jgi:peptidyl-prolyl cis-trans isomerase A (cyclophilin A)